MSEWVDDLERLAELRGKGLLSEEEYEASKRRLIKNTDRPAPRPRPRPPRVPPKRPASPRPLPLGPSIPLALAGVLMLVGAIYPEAWSVRDETGVAWEVGLPVLSAHDTWEMMIEGFWVVQRGLVLVLCLILALLPFRRQWMAWIPFGVFLALWAPGRLFYWSIDSVWILVEHRGFLPVFLPWFAVYPSTLGSVLLAVVLGVRLRMPLGASLIGVLIGAVVIRLFDPSYFHVLVELPEEGSDVIWTFLGNGGWVFSLPVLLAVGSLVALSRHEAGRWAAGLYFVLLVAIDIVGSSIVVSEIEQPLWVQALGSGATYIWIAIWAMLGLSIGQPDRFPEPDTPPEAESPTPAA